MEERHSFTCKNRLYQPCPVTPDGEHIWIPPDRPHCEACGYPDWDWNCMQDGCSCQCHDHYYEVFLPLMERLQPKIMDACFEQCVIPSAASWPIGPEEV
jgi:hypothetical protein